MEGLDELLNKHLNHQIITKSTEKNNYKASSSYKLEF